MLGGRGVERRRLLDGIDSEAQDSGEGGALQYSIPSEGNYNSVDIKRSTNHRRQGRYNTLLQDDDDDPELFLRLGWGEAMPDELFVKCFGYLDVTDLARACCVNRSWKSCIYNARLWQHLDMFSMCNFVHDAVLGERLALPYQELLTLSLDGCTAITEESLRVIARCCPSLESLSLMGLDQLEVGAVVTLVRHLPMLRRLEIYGVTQDYLVAEDLLAVRPDLDLGVFYLMYCASTGQNVETGENAVCRHDNPRQQEACFGPIRGRPIMSSLHHSRPGNMPLRVIFSCQHHMEEDISDPALYVCGVCEHYFEESGMYSEVVCKVCYDTRNLMHKARWTDLDHTHSIADFSFADIISRAMYITDRRNLPNTLTSYGSVNVVIDYKRQSAAVPEAKRLEEDSDSSDDELGEGQYRAPTAIIIPGLDDFEGKDAVSLDDVDVEAKGVGREGKTAVHQRGDDDGDWGDEPAPSDPDDTKAPLSVFLQGNRRLISSQVEAVWDKLAAAKRAGCARACLLYNAPDGSAVEVFADKRAILDRRGYAHVQLMNQAWRHANGILWPVLIVMLAVVYFVGAYDRMMSDLSDMGSPIKDYATGIESPSDDDVPMDLVYIVIGFFVLMCGSVGLMVYNRELCIRLYRVVILLDAFALFFFGSLSLLYLLAFDLRIPLDLFTFFLVPFNVAVAAVWSLYHASVPAAIHRGFLILFIIILAVILLLSFPWWLNVPVLATLSVADVLAMVWPHRYGEELAPFVLPTQFQLMYDTPRFLFHIGPLRLRTLDLMTYGIMVGLLHRSVGSITIGMCMLMVGILSVVFVTPYFGKQLRPLPFGLVITFLVYAFAESTLLPGLLDGLMLKTLTGQTLAF